MSFATEVSNYAEAAIRLFYPAFCALCPTFLEMDEAGLCRRCLGELRALRLDVSRTAFRPAADSLDAGWCLYPYESPVKETIAAIKFQKKRWLCRLFAEDFRFIAPALSSEEMPDAVLPVPMDRMRLVQREFNQTQILARMAAAALNIPILSGLLIKKCKTPAQSLLSRSEREINLLGAFGVRNARAARGKRILLIDDIYTTGSTASAIASQLKKSGAARVSVLALAKTEIS